MIGDRFVQIGDWRLGDADGRHFSIAHKDGFTAAIFREDGTFHDGPRAKYGCTRDQLTTWNRNDFNPQGVYFGERFVQIGDWRIGDADGRHSSIAHKNGFTAYIWREDGTCHHGPRAQFRCSPW